MKNFSFRYEYVILAFFLVNALTFSVYTTVWMDEVMFTDPAANLYFGHGFISSAWPTQSCHAFWAGNVPLYAGLLALWFHYFGFGFAQTRLFDLLLWSAAVWLLCAACRRLQFIKGRVGLGILAALCFLGQSVVYNYRSGRYDPLHFLLVTGALFALSLENKGWRYGLLFFTGIFFIPAGAILAPYTATMMGMAVLFAGTRYLRELLALGVGIILGGALLYGFFSAHGSWPAYVNSTMFLKNISRPPGPDQSYLLPRLARILPSLTTEKSTVLLSVLLALVYLLGMKSLPEIPRKVAQFSLLLFLVLPPSCSFSTHTRCTTAGCPTSLFASVLFPSWRQVPIPRSHDIAQPSMRWAWCLSPCWDSPSALPP